MSAATDPRCTLVWREDGKHFIAKGDILDSREEAVYIGIGRLIAIIMKSRTAIKTLGTIFDMNFFKLFFRAAVLWREQPGEEQEWKKFRDHAGSQIMRTYKDTAQDVKRLI